MAWTTPKTDWAVPDIVQTTDMNEIGENLQDLYYKLHRLNPSATASASQLTLDSDYRTHYVNGNTNVDYISTTGRVPGEHITIIYNGGTTIDLVKYVSGSIPAGFGAIVEYQTITMQNLDAITFVNIDSATWVPIFCNF